MSSGTEHLKRTFSVCLNQKQHFESYFMDNWQNYEHRQEVPTTKLKCGIVPCLFFRACKDPSSPLLFTCLFDSNLSARRHGSAVAMQSRLFERPVSRAALVGEHTDDAE